MLVYEGPIVTCDPEDHQYRYLVEDGGRIVHMGDALPPAWQEAPREVLGNRALLPALGDAHLHFASFAIFNAGLDVRGARTIDEISARLKDFAAGTKDPLILGFGVSAHSVGEQRLVDRHDLDRTCPNRPVFLVKYDGHACVVNSALLALLPAKIRALRGYSEESGQMNHEAYFATTDFVTGKVPLWRLVGQMQLAVDALAHRGLGLVHDVAGVGFPGDIDVDLERFLARGLCNGFQTRIFFQTMDEKKAIKRGLPRIGGCFATALDGCFGSADAAMLEPYRHEPNNRGVLFYTDELLTDFAIRANRAGLQIEMHAIGDAAFEQAVRVLDAALRDHPRQDHRHGIIHACLPTHQGLERCAELGIQLPIQPGFLHWDLEPYSYLEGILGDRVDGLYPLRKMADMGLMMSGSSDAPCTDPDPLLGIWSACNHYVPEQRLTISEALKLYTWNVAWGTFDEKERGSLEVGKRADMVILNVNPLALKPEELNKLRVESLLLAGQAYQSAQAQNRLWLMLRGLLSRQRV